MATLARAPGKVYIAGEYAVVASGHPAVIAAVDRFVTVYIQKREGNSAIQLECGGLFCWLRDEQQRLMDDRTNRYRFMLAAVAQTEHYLQHLGKPLVCYYLSVSSDMEQADGRKYGLGSSAAVTVATVRALLRFYEVTADRDTVFKLSALAHLRIQGNGSCGDIAASIYGGWIAYSAFDGGWLEQRMYSGADLPSVLQAQWPGLSVRPLRLPDSLDLLIGWTGTPASTGRLVAQVAHTRQQRPAAYRDFLDQSRACVEQMIAGFSRQQPRVIQHALRRNRVLLQQLAALCGLPIETEKLRLLCAIAEKYGGAAKSSGAGGGDCGIVLAGPAADQDAIKKEWEQQGIIPLDFRVCERMDA